MGPINVHDDLQQAKSQLRKTGGAKWFDRDAQPTEWHLEVRSEYNLGSYRLGEMTFRGEPNGTLTLRLSEIVKY